MQHMNCIVIWDHEMKHILFCKRRKNPFQGLYNFVGGKVENDETSEHAAYREMNEETGFRRNDLTLYHLMDLIYYVQDLTLEIYTGCLNEPKVPEGEENPLTWMPLTENFTDPAKYAGLQNIAHIINIAKEHPEVHRRLVSIDQSEEQTKIIQRLK